MTSLSDLPFGQVEPLALFGLDPDRDAPADHEHVRFGWCSLPGVELVSESQTLWVPAPVVFALHGADEDEIEVPRRGGVPSDINLEFILEDDRSAIALLSEFMRARGPEVVGEAQSIVLALCNPRRARISKPPVLAGRRIYYGTDDVVAWLRRRDGASSWALDDDNAFVQLASAHWYTC